MIAVGESVRCAACGHEMVVTADWVRDAVVRHFPNRKAKVLRASDLEKVGCSHCGAKNLEQVDRSHVRATPASAESDSQTQKLAVAVVDQASALEREILLKWAQQLVAIRDSNMSTMDKAKASIARTYESEAIWPLLNLLGRELKRIGWDERGLPARIGLSAAALALVLPGKGAAGLAALGGAIGVPLWVVFGAGGAFVGVIIDEIRKQPPAAAPSHPTEKIIEGEVLEGNAVSAKRGRQSGKKRRIE
jgi:hypothetical protein